jgi:hypothetical protein
LLENAIAELQQLDCLTASMYNRLVNTGAKINFAIGTQNSNPAQYDSSTKTLSFFNNSAITASNILEELFHALQDAHYSGGISQYANVGYSNVEFEAKLYKDVVNINTGCCSMFPNDLVPANISDSYLSLVISIQNLGPTSFTSGSYNYWVNLFRQYNPNTPYIAPTSGNFSDTDLLNILLIDCNN